MKKFTIISILVLFSLSSYATVDIEEYFSASSTGQYYPYMNNGTIKTKFDFIVNQGPVSQSFTIVFVLSEDMSVFDKNDIVIDSFRVNGAPNGNSEFPTDYGPQAPYIINQILKKPYIVHGKMYFLGCILDYNDEIAESDETNNSGAIQIPPITIVGNVGFNTNLGFWSASVNPNPITDYAIINVSGSKVTNSIIQIYSNNGQLLRSISVPQFPYKFIKKDLSTGIYNMIIYNDNKAIIRRRLIIQ